MAEIMVQEVNKISAEGQGIRKIETSLRELVREVRGQALGQYLEQQDEQMRVQEVVCDCGEALNYVCRRPATIVSVFGREISSIECSRLVLVLRTHKP